MTAKKKLRRLWHSAVYWLLVCATALCYLPRPGIDGDLQIFSLTLSQLSYRGCCANIGTTCLALEN